VTKYYLVVGIKLCNFLKLLANHYNSRSKMYVAGIVHLEMFLQHYNKNNNKLFFITFIV